MKFDMLHMKITILFCIFNSTHEFFFLTTYTSYVICYNFMQTNYKDGTELKTF